MLGAAQIAIGAAAIFARFALTGAGPLSVSALRLAIASVPLAAIAVWTRRYRVFDGATERRLALGGLILAVHFATWITSLRFASVAVSTLLVCTIPIFTETYATIRARRIDRAAALSVGCALAGVAFVVGVPSRTETPLGIALALCGALAMASYLLIVRASDARYDTLAVVGRTYPIATVLLAVAALAAGDHLPAANATAAWGGILAMALISQLFGHTALNSAVRTLSATFVGTAILLEPLIAAVLAAFVFGERLGPATLVGAALIVGGIVIAVRAET